jgi:hypothetical protein
MSIHLTPTKDQHVRVTFALPLDEPTGRVSVVGDFNDWTPEHTSYNAAPTAPAPPRSSCRQAPHCASGTWQKTTCGSTTRTHRPMTMTAATTPQADDLRHTVIVADAGALIR